MVCEHPGFSCLIVHSLRAVMLAGQLPCIGRRSQDWSREFRSPAYLILDMRLFPEHKPQIACRWPKGGPPPLWRRNLGHERAGVSLVTGRSSFVCGRLNWQLLEDNDEHISSQPGTDSLATFEASHSEDCEALNVLALRS